LLPGTTDYLADISHPIKIDDDSFGINTVSGILSTQVGWVNDLSQDVAGYLSGSPGVLFEGEAYPLAPSSVINWLPEIGETELLNFPAQAWWGPSASSGAIQLREPEISGDSKGDIQSWVGTNTLNGAFGQYSGPNLALNASYRHSIITNLNDASDSFSALGKIQIANSENLDIHAGFLTAQNSLNNNWYSFVGDLQWSPQDFQTIQLRPFIQTAKTGDQNTTEFGSDLNYHISFAGLAESNFGFGISQKNLAEVGETTKYLSGFIENSELIDILGSFSADGAFRFDFAGNRPTLFSSLIGLQYTEEGFTVLGDYGDGFIAPNSIPVQKEDLGLRIHFEDNWRVTFTYIHEYNAMNVLNGVNGQIMWDGRSLSGRTFDNLHMSMEGQILKNLYDQDFVDFGFSISWRLFQSLEFRFVGRALGAQSFYSLAGISYLIFPKFKVFAVGENLGNDPISWPDSDLSSGFNFIGGANLEF